MQTLSCGCAACSTRAHAAAKRNRASVFIPRDWTASTSPARAHAPHTPHALQDVLRDASLDTVAFVERMEALVRQYKALSFEDQEDLFDQEDESLMADFVDGIMQRVDKVSSRLRWWHARVLNQRA